MDWATHDYTRTYSDTLFVPEPEYDSGVQILDEGAEATSGRATPKVASGRALRERYYAGGNVISSRANEPGVAGVTWDERPAHYSPHAGAEWAHLTPPDRRRQGYPAPFPRVTTSEAQVGPRDLFRAALGGPPAGGLPSAAVPVAFFLLIVIIVALAMLVAAATRHTHQLEKMVKKALMSLRDCRPARD